MSAPKIIAEIGCNHKGDFSVAREMVQVAATFCKVDVVKFQKRCPRELLSAQQYAAPHPNPIHAYGSTYGEHRENLEFDLEQHRILKALAEELGAEYSTSVWDLTSARGIISLDPKMIKIPSATNVHFDLLGLLCDSFAGEIHVSLGMTTRDEEEEIVSFLTNRGRGKDTVLYACTSGYPVPFEDLCLMEITRLKATYAEAVKAIGFSGHHLGIAADIAAITLGAQWVERHFTLDRTWRGTDHAASLEPDGMRKLCRDIRNVDKALRYKSKEILEIEVAQRSKLKWNKG